MFLYYLFFSFLSLFSHHLTAFLGLTLLILGIVSLLAYVVVLCYWTKLVWKSFFSVFFFLLSSQSFSAIWCLQPTVGRLWSSEMLIAEASISNRLMLMSLFCIVFLQLFLTKLSFSSPDILHTRSLLFWKLLFI